MRAEAISWSHKSVIGLEADSDPVNLIRERARDLVLSAFDKGWSGPPFNPTFLAGLVGANLEANSSIADARLLLSGDQALIEYNPRQARERTRFSIAHEVAHMLFPDWKEEVRHRNGPRPADTWQLEMLCNIAASEFVMPIGSIGASENISPIENLMRERREYDVSAEAFLIRAAQVSKQPAIAFFASAREKTDGNKEYFVDYTVSSLSAREANVRGKKIPTTSAVYQCNAIGQTVHSDENFLGLENLHLECVGLRSYSGSHNPRVGGILRYRETDESGNSVSYRQGNILSLNPSTPTVICQLVNDKSLRWGAGFARKVSQKYPKSQVQYIDWVKQTPRKNRLGNCVLTQISENISIASLVAQEGYGDSLFPRIRYLALEKAFEKLLDRCRLHNLDVVMPRIGTGQSGGEWDVVEEIISNVFLRNGIKVTVYDLPPPREQLKLF